MPFYICEYVGDGTRAVPFRPALFDEAQGCSAIDLRPDASKLDGGGLNAALVWCPLDLVGPKWIKLGLDKLENLSGPRVQAIYSKLKIASRNAGARIDDVLADLLITPPSKGWNGLLPNRGVYEIWLGPKTSRESKLLFSQAIIAGGATDSFNRTNENPISSPWTKLTGGSGTLQLLSNAMSAVDTGDKFYYYSGGASSADQYSQFLYASAIDNNDWGPAVRIGVSGFSGYWLNLYAASQEMSKFVSGTFTTVEAYTITVTTGVAYKITASGSTLSGFKGGTEVTGSPSTDTSLTTAGNGVGLFMFNINGSIDDFDGGDLGGGGTNYSVTVTDGIMMLDPQTKTEDHALRDAMLLGDSNLPFLLRQVLGADGLMLGDNFTRIEEHTLADYLLLGDSAIAEKLKEVFLTDGLFMNDELVKVIEATQADKLFLNDTLTKIVELFAIDFLLLSPQALAGQVYDLIISEYLFLDDGRISAIDKTIAEGLFLLDVVVKTLDKVVRDSPFLSDSATTELTGTNLLDILVSDGVYMLDAVVKEQLATQRDSILMGDDRFSELLKIFTDSLMLRSDRGSEMHLTQIDRMLISDLLSQVQEKLIPEGLYLSDDVARAVSQAVVAALVYARIRSVNFLGAQAGFEKNFLGITAAWEQPND